MKVAVVGAGIMGASTALALSDRGHDVDVYEQFLPGHLLGSSHGNSRIVRRDYPDPCYTEIMMDAYPLWKGLDQRLNGGLLYECGLIYAGHRDSDNLKTMRAGLESFGVSYELIDSTTIADVFPAFRMASDEIAIHDINAGWVDARKAVSGLLELAMSQGALVHSKKVQEPLELLRSYDAVCLCMGAWITHHVQLDATVICQTFGYVDVGNPTEHGPVWIEDDTHEIYGFPPEPGRSQVKFGVHSPGPTVNPDDPGRPVTQEKVDLLADFASRRFGIQDPVIQEACACLYTKTPDNDFRFGEAAPGVFWASPCSGHGFKFGPWVGQRMADFAEGKLHPNQFPRFSTPSL